MIGLARNTALAAGLALALAGTANAAPITPGERTDVTATQRHEARDVQTGDFRPHGTLTRQQSDAMARSDRRAVPNIPAAPVMVPDKHYPY